MDVLQDILKTLKDVEIRLAAIETHLNDNIDMDQALKMKRVQKNIEEINKILNEDKEVR